VSGISVPAGAGTSTGQALFGRVIGPRAGTPDQDRLLDPLTWLIVRGWAAGGTVTAEVGPAFVDRLRPTP